jgi:hypothetical protein
MFPVKLETTNFMELSPSWEAANRSDTQEFPNILWNPKVYYLYYRGLFSNIHFNIILPPTSMTFSFWFSHQNFTCVLRVLPISSSTWSV